MIQRSRKALLLDGRMRLRQPGIMLVGPCLLALALLTGYRWLFFLAYTAILLPLLAYWWVRVTAIGLRLERTSATNVVQVGERVREIWQLHNQTALPIVWLTIDDQTTLPEHGARRATGAGPHERATWEVRTPCTMRGHYQFGPATLTTGDPLGLFEAQWALPATSTITVYPPILHLPSVAIPGGRRGGTARTNLLHHQTTPSTGTIRPYQQGDVPSRIHWPSSVRRQELMVKAFDQEQAGAIYLLLDLAALAHYQVQLERTQTQDIYAVHHQHSIIDPQAATVQFTATVELTVALACSLAAMLLGQGRIVGLQTTGHPPRTLAPDRGMRQQWRIVEELVNVSADGAFRLTNALPTLARQMPTIAHSSVVLVTPDVSGEWLPAFAPWVARNAAAVVLAGATRTAAEPLAQQLSRTATPLTIFPIDEPIKLRNSPETASARRSPFGRMVAPTNQ